MGNLVCASKVAFLDVISKSGNVKFQDDEQDFGKNSKLNNNSNPRYDSTRDVVNRYGNVGVRTIRIGDRYAICIAHY